MEDKLVTLAIHTYEKAQILKMLLESEGVEVFIHNVNQIQPVVSAGVRVRIKESDLPHALRIIEATQFFKEEEEPQENEGVKKILIPIDFSDYSMHACKIGFEYADRMGAEVMLLHSYYTVAISSSLLYLGMGLENNFEDKSLQMAYERMQANLKNMISDIDKKILSGELPRVKYSYILREGVPDDEIIAYAKQYPPTLIVMGTRGEGRKKLDLIGSVTAEVIERTKVPLLAIPEDITFDNLKDAKHIAFAISFDQQDLITFDHFMKLMKGYTPKIHLFNISTSKDEWNEIRLTGTREYFKKQYPDIDIDYTVLSDGDLLESIDKFVEEKHVDIITLTTYRRSLITRIFNPSIARRMLFHTNTGLLVIPKG